MEALVGVACSEHEDFIFVGGLIRSKVIDTPRLRLKPLKTAASEEYKNMGEFLL